VTAQVLLLGANLAAISVLTPLVPLLVYVLLGYLLVLHAALVRPRLGGGDLARPAVLGTLLAWVVAWSVFKQGGGGGWLASVPLLSLGAYSPQVLGASYIFLKTYDLIRRAQRGEPPPGLGAYLFQMTFAPSFIAGPVAGPEPFAAGPGLTRRGLGLGLNRVLVGVFKLFVLVPLLEPMNLLSAPDALDLAQLLGRGELWLGLYGSALSLYLDFAGYGDIAIGLGLCCGVRLPENFDSPYLAANPSEFWQRWHMSFTGWLREHVFGPVSRALTGGPQGGGLLALLGATCATMLACGLWHRASLSFALWGLYHAVLLFGHQAWATRLRPRLVAAGLGRVIDARPAHVMGVLGTFHAIALGWPLFLPLDAPLAARLDLLRRLVLP
jgi:D-alanyl-lipoteichoic acid acyltransferase DltB (MBOAT superfamily)